MAKSLQNSNLPPAPPPTIPSSWAWYSHSPLRGLGLAREKLEIHAWDDSGHIYLLDALGKLIAERRLPTDVIGVARADTGSRLAAVTKEGWLWWLDEKLEVIGELNLHIDVVSIAIDPHGDYVAVSAQGSRLVIISRIPKVVGSVQTSQTYRFLSFVPATGKVIGVAEQGTVACHDLRGTLIWKETMYSTVGSLAVDETGGTIVLAAYGHGLLRFDAKGRREGTYHIEHTPNLVSVEIDGSRLMAASIDGYVTAFDYEGTVLFDRKIGDKASALAMDALGRFVVLGFESGEVRFLSRDSLSLGSTASSQDGTDLAAYVLRSDSTAGEDEASWQTEIASTSEEAASAVLQAVGSSGQIAVYTTRKTLRIYDAAGEVIHESPRLDGVGRTLHASETLLIAASDRRLLSYDPASRTSILANSDLYDISHFFALDQVNEAIVVESCDQIRRIHLPGETLWKHRLPMRISSIAVDSMNRIAMVLEDHQLVVVDAAGKPIGRYRNRKPVPMIVAEMEKGWVSASLGEQILRGHSTEGKVLWEESLAWDPWSLQQVAQHIVVTSSDGRSLLASPTGEVLAESQEPREGAIYFPLTPNVVGRIYLSGMAVIVSNFEGKLLWRRSLPDRPTSFTAREQVFWGVVGRSLLSFSLPKTERITS